tara:strand:- start:402 stop:665 length:264 start_codon:yes stop_codon:yes gene_type:complete
MKKKLIDELPEEFQELFRFAKVYKNELDRKDSKETPESDELLGLAPTSREDIEEEKQNLNHYVDNDIEVDENEINLNWISEEMRETI